MVLAVLVLFERLGIPAKYYLSNLLQGNHPLFSLGLYVRLSHVLWITPTNEFVEQKHMARLRNPLFPVLYERCAVHHVLERFANRSSLLFLGNHCLLSLLLHQLLHFRVVLWVESYASATLHELIVGVRQLDS